MIPLAIIGSVLIGVVLILFVNRKTHCRPYILVLCCDGHEGYQAARSLLEGKVLRCVEKSKAARPGQLEVNLEIRLKEDNTDFVEELSALTGVQSAVMVSYNGDNHEALCSLLGVDPALEAVAVLLIGYPEETDAVSGATTRNSLTEKTNLLK